LIFFDIKIPSFSYL